MQPSAVFKKSSFYRFGTRLFLVILLGAIVSATTLYYVLPKELPPTFIGALRELKTLRENLYLKTYLVYLPIAVFIFIGVVALSQSLTKKIVGQLRSISDFSRVLGNGDFSKRPPIEGDDLPLLVKRLNELIDAYRGRLGSIKESASRLEEIHKSIEDHLEKDAQKEIKVGLKELIEITKEIDGMLLKKRV